MIPRQSNHDLAEATTNELLGTVPNGLGLRTILRHVVWALLDERVRIAMMLVPFFPFSLRCLQTISTTDILTLHSQVSATTSDTSRHHIDMPNGIYSLREILLSTEIWSTPLRSCTTQHEYDARRWVLTSTHAPCLVIVTV